MVPVTSKLGMLHLVTWVLACKHDDIIILILPHGHISTWLVQDFPSQSLSCTEMHRYPYGASVKPGAVCGGFTYHQVTQSSTGRMHGRHQSCLCFLACREMSDRAMWRFLKRKHPDNSEEASDEELQSPDKFHCTSAQKRSLKSTNGTEIFE
ncbi:uncharacterized protein LOC110833914 isoform X2 [Zootermopsis nevadensis]|uniref:uncharacterized protein LOC110833914 isoform X2 n=1 Tax=Zootermopsis nevadensis TaxID=136037 RepID=UPI000B8E4BD1|nr:uncharacterized protein LOC110833914 isoform X2 [Zootermopsis nevadensis]